MNKRLLLTLIVLCFIALAGIVPAYAVYLDSSWYAELTNVTVSGGSYSSGFNPQPSSSEHITAATTNHIGASWAARFSITQSGQAPANEYASWSCVFLDPANTLGSITFNYKTYWTQPNLVLELWADYLDPQQTGGRVWSSSLTGLRTGLVTINANPNAYSFRLAVVPEPSSLFTLGLPFSISLMVGVKRVLTKRRLR